MWPKGHNELLDLLVAELSIYAFDINTVSRTQTDLVLGFDSQWRSSMELLRGYIADEYPTTTVVVANPFIIIVASALANHTK